MPAAMHIGWNATHWPRRQDSPETTPRSMKIVVEVGLGSWQGKTGLRMGGLSIAGATTSVASRTQRSSKAGPAEQVMGRQGNPPGWGSSALEEQVILSWLDQNSSEDPEHEPWESPTCVFPAASSHRLRSGPQSS